MELYLTPTSATILFIFAVCSGHLFRKSWKEQSRHWKIRAWIYGCIAGFALLALGFIPLRF